MCNCDGGSHSDAPRKGDPVPWKQKKLSTRVLLPPVITLDDRFVDGMVEQKARRLVIILTSAGMLRWPSGAHVSNPGSVVRGQALYLPNTGGRLPVNEGADHIRLMACSAICASLARN